MALARTTKRLPLSAAACLLIFSGCGQARLKSEVARLEDQLNQADARLAVATAQLEAASTNSIALEQTIETLRSEKDELAARMTESEMRATVRQEELQAKTAEALAMLANTRRELVAAQRPPDQTKDLNADSKPSLSPLGVWELHAGEDRYRISFYEDGGVVVRLQTGEGNWVKPSAMPFRQGHFYLASSFNFQEIEPGAIELFTMANSTSYTKTKVRYGRLSMDSETSASIWFDFAGGESFKDEFNKPKWLPIKKVAEPSKPLKQLPVSPTVEPR
jgi:hypothetical protein